MIGQMPVFAPEAVRDWRRTKKARSTRMNCVLFGEPITYLAVKVGLVYVRLVVMAVYLHAWFLADPVVTTAGRTDRGGTGNTVINIQSGRANLGLIPSTTISSSATLKFDYEKEVCIYMYTNIWSCSFPYLIKMEGKGICPISSPQ